MKKDFFKKLADLFSEQIGLDIFKLRSENKEYQSLIIKKNKLIETKYISLEEQRKAFKELIRIDTTIHEIDIHFAFLLGMREYKHLIAVSEYPEFINDLLDLK